MLRLRLPFVLLLASLCSCDGTTPGPGEGTAKDSAPPTNLLLITLDTTRVDRLGCYGHAEAQTPNLDSLAREGARFTRAYAQVPLTLPSHASLLTGTFPPEHGIHDNGRTALGPELTTLAELFRSRGYRTGAFIAALALDGSFGLDRGFDVYADELGTQRAEGPALIQRRGDEVADEALAWLNQGEGPFFAWVHFYDPHARYQPPADFALADPYDGEIAFMDAQIGRLLGWLDAQRLADSTLVVAVADHGESLGEHGEKTHGSFIYQGTQHIPLLLRGPGVATGVTSGALAQQVDLLPTLTELFGWPRVAQASGRSLAPALTGRELDPGTAYIESEYCALNFGWSPLHGLIHDKWKFIQAPTRELYDLEADPGETVNLAAQHPELAASLEGLLEELRGSMQAHEAVDAGADGELSRALAELGYAQGFGASAGADLETGRNPIDFVDALELYHEAVGHGHLGEPERAIAPLEEVVRQCPDSAGFLAVLGETYVRVGRAADAVPVLERALELDGGYDPAYFYLGRARASLGEYEEAIRCFEATLELNSRSLLARRALARLLWSRGNSEEALEHFEVAAEVDPNSAQSWLEVASLRAELGRWVAAKEALERAAAIAPKDPALINFFGWVLSTAPEASARDGARAVALLQPIVAASPSDPSLYDSLAAAYAESGRFEEARATAERALELAREQGAAELEVEVQRRLELYRVDKPYHEG